MQRLSGLDASFLYLETPNTHMHVVGVLVLDPAGMDGGYSFEGVRQMMADRIHLMPPFRRRLVNVPLGLDHPVWIDDGDFDIENHVHRTALPAPGGQRALEDLVGDLAGRQLDRRRPLWEMWVVEGLEDGRVAIVTKMHHSSVDGASGADLMVHLFDLTPEVRPIDPPETAFEGEEPPSDLRLITRGLATQALNPFRLVRQVARSTGRVAETAKTVLKPLLPGRDEERATLPFTAPRVAWSGALTPHRSVAFGRSSLDDLKTIKNAFGAKVNDVVLAVTTQSLRAYLQAHGGLPDKPLLAGVPVAVQPAEGSTESSNSLSSLLVPLPIQEPDPATQLEVIVESTKRSKELSNALGAETLMDWAQFMAPRLFTTAMRLYAGTRLADFAPVMQNLIVSNVPGPPIPLYCAGARVEAIYPMGPLLPGAGLNVTVLSNMGNVDWGVIACRETVPEVHRIAEGFPEAVATLLAAAEARVG